METLTGVTILTRSTPDDSDTIRQPQRASTTLFACVAFWVVDRLLAAQMNRTCRDWLSIKQQQ